MGNDRKRHKIPDLCKKNRKINQITIKKWTGNQYCLPEKLCHRHFYEAVIPKLKEIIYVWNMFLLENKKSEICLI